MTYVEWLRIRKVLRIVAIIFGALIIISAGFRVYFNKEITSDDAMIMHVQRQPGSTVAHSVLPDGTKRTTINDPSEQTTVIIDNHGASGRHIEITRPWSKANRHESHFMFGSLTMREHHVGNMEVTVIDTDSRTPFIFYLGIAALIGLFVATALASPFARENDGHLEYALTKPVSREGLALQTIGADIAGIAMAEVIVIVAMLICQAMFEIPNLDLTGVNAGGALMAILGPAAWYAMILAATSSMKRGYGAVIGFAWPVAILVLALEAWSAYWTGTLGQSLHGLLWLTNHLNPLAYLGNFSVDENHSTGTLVTSSPAFGPHLLAQSLLFIVYSALAVFQWKRVEA